MRYQIIHYQTVDPAAPTTCVCLAGLRIGYDAQPRWYCSGPTPEAAEANMMAFWEKEQRHYGVPKAAPKPPQPSPAVDTPEPAIALDDPGDVV